MGKDVMPVPNRGLEEDNVRARQRARPGHWADSRTQLKPAVTDQRLAEHLLGGSVRHQNVCLGVHPQHWAWIHLRKPSDLCQQGGLLGQELFVAPPGGDVGAIHENDIARAPTART